MDPKAAPVVHVTPAAMSAARRRVHLDQRAAASLISDSLATEGETRIGEETIAGWESGEIDPTLVQAEAAATAYFVPFPWLFRERLPEQPLVDFRLRKNGRQEQLSYAAHAGLAQFEDFYRVAKLVTRALDMDESEVTVPAYTGGTHKSADAEQLGAEMRRALGITDDLQLAWSGEEAAATDVRARIELTGAFVFTAAMPLSECRGASKWETSGPPAILVNAADSFSAQLFTMVHEFAHLMVRQVSPGVAVCDPSVPPSDHGLSPEQFANRAAAAALVPKSLLELSMPSKPPKGSYREWPEAERRRLKRVFKVSHDVIGIRLFHLGIAGSPQWSQTFWRQPVPDGFGRSVSVANKLRRSLGDRTLRLANQAVRTEKVAPFELKRLLRLKMDDINLAIGV